MDANTKKGLSSFVKKLVVENKEEILGFIESLEKSDKPEPKKIEAPKKEITSKKEKAIEIAKFALTIVIMLMILLIALALMVYSLHGSLAYFAQHSGPDSHPIEHAAGGIAFQIVTSLFR